MHNTRAGEGGFTLLEVMVALVIASLGLLALFEFQRELTRAQRSAERAMLKATMRRSVMSMLRDSNPMAQPQGQVVLPPGRFLQWAVRPASVLKQGIGARNTDGPYQVQVFTVTARVTDAQGRVLDQFNFDRLGWRRPAPPVPVPPASAPQPALP